MASPVATVRLEGKARRLATYVLRMERRYERPSARGTPAPCWACPRARRGWTSGARWRAAA